MLRSSQLLSAPLENLNQQIQNNKSLTQIIIGFFIFKSVVRGFSIYGEIIMENNETQENVKNPEIVENPVTAENTTILLWARSEITCVICDLH